MNETFVYYVIYKALGPDSRFGEFVTIVEHEITAQDWCKKHPECYYSEEQCEGPSEI